MAIAAPLASVGMTSNHSRTVRKNEPFTTSADSTALAGAGVIFAATIARGRWRPPDSATLPAAGLLLVYVVVLDGGLPAWERAGGALTTTAPAARTVPVTTPPSASIAASATAAEAPVLNAMPVAPLWDGACVEGMAQGSGRLAWIAGNRPVFIYEGTMQAGAMHGDVAAALLQDHREPASRLAMEWARLFPGRFYLELQRSGAPQTENR